MTLFGFASKEERAMFDYLLSVSGVGPRLALAILSRYSVSQLYSIVMAEDATSMSAVSGVGKKTAQRLILELKSTFAKDHSFAVAEAPAANQTVMTFRTSLLLARMRQALSMGPATGRRSLRLMGMMVRGCELKICWVPRCVVLEWKHNVGSRRI